MKIRSSVLILSLTLVTLKGHAQAINDKTLMTVGNLTVPAGEFIRMYKKSIEPGKKPDPDNYLQLFVVFKLKVADAIGEGFDTTRAFRNELNGYRNQLAQTYLTDQQAKDKLLQTTYQRSLTEINAWHILVSCPEGSKPADTLTAWTKASEIRERIILGEPFEQVARSTSDDPSVRINGGNLGYFTVFQMISPFEDAAYNLKKGSLSEPVRTPYGYHIIKVADKRPSKGKILVAHIMKNIPAGAGDAEMKKAEEEINAVYKELQSGVPFSLLAGKYSDHKESAINGGKLTWFGAGEIIPDFAEAAFAIRDTGKYSKPVKTAYGWHIIKLLDKKAPGTFEETRSFLESKINQSYLNSLSRRSLIDRLKKDYRFTVNQESFSWFVTHTDTLIIQGLAKYNRDSLPSGNLYTFSNQKLTNREFASFIERKASVSNSGDSLKFITQSMNVLADDQIIKYENSVLEKKYPEFRYLMNEFHDGILLFEISGKKVWNRVENDSAGMRAYYETIKNKYLTKRSVEGKLYVLRLQNNDEKFYSAYSKYSKKPDADALLMKKFNRKNDSTLIIREGIWYEGEEKILGSLGWQPGPHFIKTGNYPSVIMIKKINEPVPLSFSEIQGEMLAGYQEFLENEWVKQLKQKYAVKIDNGVFSEIKKSLGNE